MMATSISTAIKGSISLDTLTKGRWERLQETNSQGPKGGVAIPMHMTKTVKKPKKMGSIP